MTSSFDSPNVNGGDRSTPQLRRAISGRLLFLFILGDVLGAGVYVLIGEIALEVGGPVWLPLLVALGLALLTATSYAELVTKYPQAGGAAAYAQRAYGSPVVAFLVGSCMLAAGVTSAAGLAVAFSGEYFQQLIDAPSIPIALALLVGVAVLNVRGIVESLRANMVMTCIELGGLLLVVVLGVVVLSRGDGQPSRLVQFDDQVSPIPAVFAAALLAFYSYVGFETSANVAEEVRDVRKIYPRALFGALLVAGGLYVLVGAVASAAVRSDGEPAGNLNGPLVQVVQAANVGISPELFSVIALVAVANGVLITMVMASRLAYGMAREGLLPEALACVLPRRQTPVTAIVATTVVAMMLAGTGSVEALARTVVLFLLVVFASTNLAVLILRRDTVAQPHFRTPTVLPILALMSCIVLATQQETGSWVRAAVLLSGITVMYLIARIFTRRTPSLS
ncbi:MAG: APC family permease [Actinomycetota bacterium]